MYALTHAHCALADKDMCPPLCLLLCQIILYVLWGCLMASWAIFISALWGTDTQGAVLSSLAIVIFTGLAANMIVVQVRGGAG